MTSRDDGQEPERQATGIVFWLARLAAEYSALPVDGSPGADEIIGYDAGGLPS
jgi:hypothetical protein